MNLLASLFGRSRLSEDLSTRLSERIRERTGNRIRNLRVDTVHGKVLVFGDVPSQYLWQMALAAAAGGLDDPRRLEMHVNVNLQKHDRAAVAARRINKRPSAKRSTGVRLRNSPTRDDRKGTGET